MKCVIGIAVLCGLIACGGNENGANAISISSANEVAESTASVSASCLVDYVYRSACDQFPYDVTCSIRLASGEVRSCVIPAVTTTEAEQRCTIPLTRSEAEPLTAASTFTSVSGLPYDVSPPTLEAVCGLDVSGGRPPFPPVVFGGTGSFDRCSANRDMSGDFINIIHRYSSDHVIGRVSEEKDPEIQNHAALTTQLVPAYETCSCNGLAGNFPGYSLICHSRVLDRWLFDTYGVDGAKQRCEAEKARLDTR